MLNPLRAVACRPFSVVAARATQAPVTPTHPKDQGELANILDEQKITSPQLYSADLRSPWKSFPDGLTHINPHQFTYKARLNTPPPFRKRPTVGPGSAEARYRDIFYQLDLDPLEECQNADLLAGFVSEMGKIYGREKTGLTTKNQRRLGKAIRRAKQMGIIPILSRPDTIFNGWRSNR